MLLSSILTLTSDLYDNIGVRGLSPMATKKWRYVAIFLYVHTTMLRDQKLNSNFRIKGQQAVGEKQRNMAMMTPIII